MALAVTVVAASAASASTGTSTSTSTSTGTGTSTSTSTSTALWRQACGLLRLLHGAALGVGCGHCGSQRSLVGGGGG